MELKRLEALGLTPKEVDVYIALLGAESASISKLMADANVSRKSIYEILQKLLDKGLVKYTIQDNKKKFAAVSPERFLDILKEKQRSIEGILPDLLTKYKEKKEETTVNVFLGKEGMKAITKNILNVGTPFCALAYEGKIFDFLKYYMPQFMKEREKRKIHAKIIYCESFRETNIRPPLSKIKYVSNKMSSPISLVIYGDNINILIFSDTPLAIHIKSKEIAHSFMNYFNLMWAMGKK